MAKKPVATEQQAQIPPDELQGIADFSRMILGDRTRIQIVYAVRSEAKNVGELTAIIGQSQPAISHHLALLRAAKVVTNQRRGREVYYTFNPAGIKQLQEMLNSLAGD